MSSWNGSPASSRAADVADVLDGSQHHGVAPRRVALVAERVAELVEQRAELLRLVERRRVAAPVELGAAQRRRARCTRRAGSRIAGAPPLGGALDAALGLGGGRVARVVRLEGDLDLRRLRAASGSARRAPAPSASQREPQQRALGVAARRPAARRGSARRVSKRHRNQSSSSRDAAARTASRRRGAAPSQLGQRGLARAPAPRRPRRAAQPVATQASASRDDAEPLSSARAAPRRRCRSPPARPSGCASRSRSRRCPRRPRCGSA